ncbi:zinc/iron-chelating domain-containing protein [Malaciobacter molluscorum LMG 25693]|uniref:Zinc/iron-chelating domain-containing protein n=1 Tax=Malaciobacter molluscorum LMG 25693 TaxID=870501 RepID=A0A2G1DJI6_9BACT|nr:YkgJ family cysteine cluster protein [Malaciobacter molluscorum]AXX92826.1 putative [Fe-S] cluster-containing protein [Malaciobacter molluscorum LMG 25693]PHO18665.1 zinc/iron-chelating domain-containing protein [Malaciobacter molluscorum LMG 25693]RXJ96147.1 zinc/iron-chelating domain-containing protein [Malaciobacter molluscorum]
MILKQEGYNYCFDASECSSCKGNCCIGESGYIWITKDEIEKLAKHLDISLEEVRVKYLRKVGYKYSLKERQLSADNFACIFFDTQKRQCSVYEVRPTQCRTFPFWEYFKNNEKEVYEECPAIKPL